MRIPHAIVFMMYNFIRNLFVPNSHNNHKAFILHNYGLAAIVFLILGLNSGFTLANYYADTVLGASASLSTDDVIRYTNLARLSENLPALNPDPQLTQAAEAKLKDMYAFGYWDHYSPSKRTPWTFVLDAGYSYQVAGENLARDFHDPEALVKAWLNSPAHRANLLSNQYQDMGIAISEGELDGKPTVVIVQLFGKRLPPDIAQAVEQLDPEQVAAAGMLQFDSQPTAANTLTNRHLTTRAIALITVAMLIIVISFDAFLVHRFHNLPRISAKFWGHLLFLYVIGAVSLLT